MSTRQPLWEEVSWRTSWAPRVPKRRARRSLPPSARGPRSLAAEPRRIGRPLRPGKPQRPFPPRPLAPTPPLPQKMPGQRKRKGAAAAAGAGPGALLPLRPAAVDQDQYPRASGDPETIGQEVTSIGGGSKGRPGRDCALAGGKADAHGQRRKEPEAGKRAQKPRRFTLETERPLPRPALGPGNKRTGK